MSFVFRTQFGQATGSPPSTTTRRRLRRFMLWDRRQADDRRLAVSTHAQRRTTLSARSGTRKYFHWRHGFEDHSDSSLTPRRGEWTDTATSRSEAACGSGIHSYRQWWFPSTVDYSHTQDLLPDCAEL